MQPVRSRWVQAILYLALAIWTIICLFPIYWTIITSLKTPKAINTPKPSYIPWVQFQPTLKAFTDIFCTQDCADVYGASGMGNLARLFRNSFVASFTSALIAVIIGAMAAYALSRFNYNRWKNKDIAFWFVSQRMLPPIALVTPFFILFGKLDMIDKLPTLIIVYVAMNLPLTIWLLRDYFADMPIEIEEAAMVDGASRYGSFFRMALPLALPGLMVAFLFAFVFAWNEFLLSLTLTLDNAKTLPVQVAGNVTLRGPRFWDIAAQGLLVMLPPLIIAIVAGRYIVRGMAAGAVK